MRPSITPPHSPSLSGPEKVAEVAILTPFAHHLPQVNMKDGKQGYYQGAQVRKTTPLARLSKLGLTPPHTPANQLG